MLLAVDSNKESKVLSSLHLSSPSLCKVQTQGVIDSLGSKLQTTKTFRSAYLLEDIDALFSQIIMMTILNICKPHIISQSTRTVVINYYYYYYYYVHGRLFGLAPYLHSTPLFGGRTARL
jgi:hypothetical protein